MSEHFPTPTPTLYCSGFDDINVASDNPAHEHLTGQYIIVHKSSVGVKYEHVSKDVKITFSHNINNIFNGHWRWAKNSSPYTLYYANPSTATCVPSIEWKDINNSIFTGQIVSSDSLVYDFNVYKRCAISVTPTPTPTPEPTIITPTPTPVIHITPSVPSGIIRNDMTEHVWVKGKPTISYIKPVDIPVNTSRKITVHGLSLQYTTKVYLSAGVGVLGQPGDTIDIFSDIPSLSADFPGFTGIPVEFTIHSDNIVDIHLPLLIGTGSADLIILNPAGYDRLNPTYDGIEKWTDYNLQNRVITIE